MSVEQRFDLPRWVLAVAPLVVLGSAVALLAATSPFGSVESTADATPLEILWILGVIGAIAGVVPVAIGMLWFPFIRALEYRRVHAFLALSTGVLAFIAVEMIGKIVASGAAAGRPVVAATLAVVGVSATFGVTSFVSHLRYRTMASGGRTGLHVAYLVAVALGLHSVGEGLAIGTAFVEGDGTLVTLLVVGFVIHNVMEGPTIVAAVARDRTTPPLGHFLGMGVIAGGTVILGGWVGSFAQSTLLAVLFYAIAIGAILQVLIEVAELIRFDAEAVLTRTNAATFAVGFVLMFVLDDILTDVLLEGWLVPG